MCESNKPKVTVVELKSGESLPAPDLHLTTSEAGSPDEMPVSEGHKNLISEDAQKIRRRKANFEQHLCPKRVSLFFSFFLSFYVSIYTTIQKFEVSKKFFLK